MRARVRRPEGVRGLVSNDVWINKHWIFNKAALESLESTRSTNYALESTNYPVIVILSNFSWGTNLFDSKITKIASLYGFASGVCRPLGISNI